jgi:hypothetical protein
MLPIALRELGGMPLPNPEAAARPTHRASHGDATVGGESSMKAGKIVAGQTTGWN